MASSGDLTSNRKRDHISICLNEDVGFSKKTTGFELFEFEHNAITEVEFNNISLASKFFGKEVGYPFIISCMTGGTIEAENINAMLAETANQLNIPIGVGSQRQALENNSFIDSYKIVTGKAGEVPILGNIGAAQVAKSNNVSEFIKLAEMVNASAMVIHLNALQEVFQKEGEPDFKGLLKNIELLVKELKIPVIAKEVGSGISKKAARELLSCGVFGIDVAGAGGTSWSAVEMKRNNNEENLYFRDWGIPTALALKDIKKLKKDFSFTLISSGGIDNGIKIAKSIALGADFTASARPLLKEVLYNGAEGAAKLIEDWFETVKKIMYLTGCENIDQLKSQKLKTQKELI